MVNRLLDQSIPNLDSRQLLIWPETAFDDYYNAQRIRSSISYHLKQSLLKDSIDLISGVFEVEKDTYYNGHFSRRVNF